MSERAQKERKPTISSFSDFQTGLELAVKDATDKRRSSGVLSFLRRKGSFNLTEEQVHLTREALRPLPDYALLKFTIFVESCLNPRPSGVISALGAELGRTYRIDANFFEYCASEGAPKELSSCIGKWAAHLKESIEPMGSAVPHYTNAGLLRSAFACLLTRKDADDFLDASLRLLKCFFPVAAKDGSKSASQGSSLRFARAVAGLLKATNPKRGHIQLVLITGHALEERVERAVTNLNRTRSDLASLQEDFKAGVAEISGLREDAANSQKSITHLQGNVAQLEGALAQEKQKSEALDKHWQMVLQQEIAGLSARIRRQLEHEVSEIRLCLTGNAPNLEMALHRLGRVADILARLKGQIE